MPRIVSGRTGTPTGISPCCRAARPLCRTSHSCRDRSDSAPAVCLPRSRHAGNHRTRTSRGSDRPIAPVRAGRLVTVVRGAYLLTDRVPQPYAGDVGMDVVLSHVQTRRKNHLYAASPIQRGQAHVTVTLCGIRLEGINQSKNEGWTLPFNGTRRAMP